MIDIFNRLTPESVKINTFEKKLYIKFQKLKFKLTKIFFQEAMPEKDQFGYTFDQSVTPHTKY